MASTSNVRFSLPGLLCAWLGLLFIWGSWKNLTDEPESSVGGIAYMATLESVGTDCAGRGRGTCQTAAWVRFVHEGRDTRARIAPYKGNDNAKSVAIYYMPWNQRAVLQNPTPSAKDVITSVIFSLIGAAAILLGYFTSLRDPYLNPLYRRLFPRRPAGVDPSG